MNTDNLLVAYFSQYMDLSPEEIEVIKNTDIIREYEKNTVLLEAGQVAKNCFLVLKGCVRRYYIQDGEERIMDFYTENDPITPASYVSQTPSEYYLSCVEPSIISSGTDESTQEFIAKFPQFVPMFIKIGDQLSVKKQLSFDNFKNQSPEDRYQQLVATRPDLVNRVPQYMIASYLGIKPESLSRIRKRLFS